MPFVSSAARRYSEISCFGNFENFLANELFPYVSQVLNSEPYTVRLSN